MVFTRFVEVGRVVLLNKGENAGKIAVIVEIIDHNRVIVDGPTSGVERQVATFRQLSLTTIKVDLPRAARTKTVKKVLEAAKVNEQWATTGAAKRIVAQKLRANLTDFDRFKVMALKQMKRSLASA